MSIKNSVIITLIFAVPLLAYVLLSNNSASFATKMPTNKKLPQIVKFSSLMCLDCQKLAKNINEVYPKYSDKIILTEIHVQDSDSFTKKQIEKYNVTLVPTMIFLDKNGKKVKRIEGFVEKDKLDKMMKDLVNE